MNKSLWTLNGTFTELYTDIYKDQFSPVNGLWVAVGRKDRKLPWLIISPNVNIAYVHWRGFFLGGHIAHCLLIFSFSSGFGLLQWEWVSNSLRRDIVLEHPLGKCICHCLEQSWCRVRITNILLYCIYCSLQGLRVRIIISILSQKKIVFLIFSRITEQRTTSYWATFPHH